MILDGIQVINFVIGAVATLIALVVWLVRLEGRVNQVTKDATENARRTEALQIRHESLDSRIMQELANLREGLARIEGRLETMKQMAQHND